MEITLAQGEPANPPVFSISSDLEGTKAPPEKNIFKSVESIFDQENPTGVSCIWVSLISLSRSSKATFLEAFGLTANFRAFSLTGS